MSHLDPQLGPRGQLLCEVPAGSGSEPLGWTAEGPREPHTLQIIGVCYSSRLDLTEEPLEHPNTETVMDQGPPRPPRLRMQQEPPPPKPWKAKATSRCVCPGGRAQPSLEPRAWERRKSLRFLVTLCASSATHAPGATWNQRSPPTSGRKDTKHAEQIQASSDSSSAGSSQSTLPGPLQGR